MQVAGNFDFPGWSGIIQSLQNDLSLGASTSGDVVVLFPANLRPSVDLGQSLGEPELRWENVHADNINSVPTASFLPVDARDVSGQIIPDTDLAYALGNNQRRFGGLHAALVSLSGLISPVNSNITVSGHLVPGNFLEHQIGLRLNPFAAVNAFSGFYAAIETQTLSTVNSAQPLRVLVSMNPEDNEGQGLGDISTPKTWCHVVATDHYAENLIPYNGGTGGAGGDNAMFLSGFLLAHQDNAGGIGTGPNSFKWGFFQNLVLGGSSGILGASDQAAGIATSGNIMPLENLAYGLGDRSTPRTFGHIVAKEHYVEDLIPYRSSDGAAGLDRLMNLSGFMVPHVANAGGIGTPARRFQIVATRQLNVAALPFGGHIDANGDEVPFSGGIIPLVDGGYSVGTANNRWCDVRACSGVFDTLFTTDGAPIITSGVQVLYVAKHGNDGYEGTNPTRPLLTFARAAEVASGLNPGFNNRICIRGIDGGTYDDLVYLLPYVDIIAECIEFRGHITTFENNTVQLGKIFNDTYSISAFPQSQGSAISKYDNGGSGSVTVRANELEVRGPDALGLTLIGGVQNASISGTMYIDIDHVATVSGVSLVAGGGRTAVDIGDMEHGDGTNGLIIGSLATEARCDGTIRSIRQGGLLPAISINTNGCSGNLFVGSITRESPSSIAWQVNGNNCSLRMLIHNLEGTEDDSGTDNEICVVKTCDITSVINNVGGSVVTSLNNLSGVVALTSPDASVNIATNGQNIELTTPTSGAPSGASYLLREYDDNDHLTQARVLSATSGLRLNDQGARSTSGLVLTFDVDNEPTANQVLKWNGSNLTWSDDNTGGGGGGSASGVTSLNGLSGVVELTSPNGTVGIVVNGQSIELEASGLCSTHTFGPANGRVFTVAHNLNTENFVWSLWRTDTDPHTTTFGNVAPSGANHAVVELATDGGINGKLVLHGCAPSGVSVGRSVGTRTITTSYEMTLLDEALFANPPSDISVALPNPSGKEGESVYIKNQSTNTITAHTNGSGLIDDNTEVLLSQYDALRAIAHNGNWWIM